MYTIESAKANPDFTVTIRWTNGHVSTVDFSEIISWGEVMKPLRDREFFVSNLYVGHEGGCLGWPEEIDFCADALWYETHPDDFVRDEGHRVGQEEIDRVFAIARRQAERLRELGYADAA